MRPALFNLLLLLLLASTPSSAEAFTFFISSDPHYGRHAWTDNERVNKQAIDDMNDLPGTSLPPPLEGWVEEPLGVLVPGDLSGGTVWDWWGYWWGGWVDGFTQDYGVNGEGRLRFPVYEGFGNHDVHRDDGGLTTLMGIYWRNTQRATPVNTSANGLHYSFDWQEVHFINLNLYPGTGRGSWGSLEFLKEDLETQVGTSGRPVILYHHYPFNTGERWWSEKEKETYLKIIRPYRIQAIFAGHIHHSMHYVWKGFPVFTAPSVKDKAAYLVARWEQGQLIVLERSPKGWGKIWIVNG